jgi:hypothetical protein
MKRNVLGVLAGLLAAIASAGVATAAGEPDWLWSASAYFYFTPFDENYIQPTVEADRDHLHLELRYNYEDLETASAWVGYNFSVGSEIALDFTPMLGAVAGNTVGFAPGYQGSLAWRALELSSESEHFLDAENDFDSFFYTWSELTLSFDDRVTTGVAVQRTRAYESARETQRGLLLGAGVDRWGAVLYVFDPGTPDPTYVLSAYAAF